MLLQHSHPAHPTLWMRRQAPDPPLVPNPTGKSEPVSPETAVQEAQPSPRAPVLADSMRMSLT